MKQETCSKEAARGPSRFSGYTAATRMRDRSEGLKLVERSDVLRRDTDLAVCKAARILPNVSGRRFGLSARRRSSGPRASNLHRVFAGWPFWLAQHLLGTSSMTSARSHEWLEAKSRPVCDEESLHRELALHNRRRLVPTHARVDFRDQLSTEHAFRTIEGELLGSARTRLKMELGRVPRDADAFVLWFEQLERTGPGQGDPLFPWLRDRASLASMRWFLRQEMAGEAGFDDLVALTQVRIPDRAKMELARNYWDEMGQGHQGGMHSPLLRRLGTELTIVGPQDNSDVVWEALALGNLMIALATNRYLAYQSIGALGVIEQTAPGRAEHVNAGLKRLGVDGAARRYYALHATLDRQHSSSWNSEVLRPLVSADPDCALAIAEGALLRLHAGARCFDRYRRELPFEPRGVPASVE